MYQVDIYIFFYSVLMGLWEREVKIGDWCSLIEEAYYLFDPIYILKKIKKKKTNYKFSPFNIFIIINIDKLHERFISISCDINKN